MSQTRGVSSFRPVSPFTKRNLDNVHIRAHAQNLALFSVYKMADTSLNSTTSLGSPLPNVNERLAQLRPSKELLEYYRRKIAEFDNEHQQMVAKLEAYRCTYEEQVCFLFLA